MLTFENLTPCCFLSLHAKEVPQSGNCEEIGSSFVGLLYSDNDDRNILQRNDANITIKRELITTKSIINNYITHKNLYVVREDEYKHVIITIVDRNVLV